MLDEVDTKILRILQENARTSNAEIGRQLDMAPSAIHERIRKLEEKGVIRSYEAHLDPHAVGSALVAFVSVRTEERWSDLESGEALRRIPEVQEIHRIAGEDCYLVKIKVADIDALRKLLGERIGAIRSITATRTTIVLETLKETTKLPVPASERPRATNGSRDGPPPRAWNLEVKGRVRHG